MEEGILEKVVKYLEPSLNLPVNLLIEVGQLLQMITDENENVFKFFEKNQIFFQILNTNLKLDNLNHHLKSLIIGTLSNLYSNNSQQKHLFFQVCFPFFQNVISQNSLESFLKLKDLVIFLTQLHSLEVNEKQKGKILNKKK